MPLPVPAPRKLAHVRAIECRGYEREDGLWDIEGHLVDTKTYVHTRRDGGRERAPGEPVHDMWLRLTIDLDLKIHDVEAATDAGPYALCGDITPNFKALVGLTIGPGWRREIAARVGGVKGCTHLVELLGPLGTVAFQATGRGGGRRHTRPPRAQK
ncbi:MAG: DUF2889 domain-containing protein, partial [Burkholderiales bacterium]